MPVQSHTLLPESQLKAHHSAIKAAKVGKVRKYRNKEGKMVVIKVKPIPLCQLHARWHKKKQHLEALASNMRKLRMNLTKDLKSDDEKTRLTALVISLMDCTAERVGNDDSADSGHFGVTGFQKKHITIIGNKIHLQYRGKSGVDHEKSFSDKNIAKQLKSAIKNSKGKFIFETTDGFRIRPDKVNRYLKDYCITAKDIRGYCANTYVIEKLKKEQDTINTFEGSAHELEKKRKSIFNKATKYAAGKVGHGTATLKNHYLMPELQRAYIKEGKILSLIDFYSSGREVVDKKADKYPLKAVVKHKKDKSSSESSSSNGNPANIITILYLHGLDSSPALDNADGLKTKGAKLISPKIDYKNKEEFDILSKLIEKEKIDGIVGHSMGAYLGHYLSNKYNIPALLFNPAFGFSDNSTHIPNDIKALPVYNKQIVVVGKNDEVIPMIHQLKPFENTNAVIEIEDINHDVPNNIKNKYFDYFVKYILENESIPVASSKHEQGGNITPIDLSQSLKKLHAMMWEASHPAIIAYATQLRDMLLHGHHFKTKESFEKIARSYGIEHSIEAKEWAEYAIVMAARKIIQKGESQSETCNKLVSLYNKQPLLIHRTSQSSRLQQYSTPAPISYLMGTWCANKNNKDVKNKEEEDNADVVKYPYKKGDKVIFFGKGQQAIVKTEIDIPSTNSDGLNQIWLTKNGYVAEKELLPYITGTRLINTTGQGYKAFKDISGKSTKKYEIEFADGVKFQSSHTDKHLAIVEAMRHRLYNVKDYPKTENSATRAHQYERYKQIMGITEQEPSSFICFEPTAGTGMLTIALPPEQWIVNEIDTTRFNILRLQGFKDVLHQDATQKFKFPHSHTSPHFDIIITNPPFGSEGSERFGNYTLYGLEQIISAKALQYLKNEGRASIIIGGNMEFDDRGRIKGKKDLAFFNYLWQHYIVDDVINISGQMYSRQGATYPIRIILISGTQSNISTYYPLSNKNTHATEKFSPKAVDNFDELYKRFHSK